ncbi:MAG TPA: YggS family pyridoxal phosphate-dependent enzyme [Candidatus Limnocylindrales bacterium]|nr:YggS family pyridoxal phosphate-dependent enzyme [Candidatus Limnocylindrales bacterium]
MAAVRERIAAACRRAGRPVEEVTLVGVAKGQPVDRLRAALAAGVTVLGENRVQEAEAHRAALAGPAAAGRPGGFPAWHLIGPLQSNKAKRAAALFDFVHSVDRTKIARILDREFAALGRRVDALVEVNLGGEATTHGFAADGLAASVRPLAHLEHLRLVGVMVIPPPGGPEGARRWFRRARALAAELAAEPEWQGFPGLLSMGMSDDFEVAVEEGATHVRVGSALFGPRADPP